jgi:UDP-glucose 4-epimerase
MTLLNISDVVHFAGLNSVGESTQIPLIYYQNNVPVTLNLCQVIADLGIKRLVFSSSATVYGAPSPVPIPEDAPVGAVTNPYGRSKYMIEEILRDVQRADLEWGIILLRVFNPTSVHRSGRNG